MSYTTWQSPEGDVYIQNGVAAFKVEFFNPAGAPPGLADEIGRQLNSSPPNFPNHLRDPLYYRVRHSVNEAYRQLGGSASTLTFDIQQQ